MVFLFWFSVGLIFYTYLGYPGMLAIVSRLRPEQDLSNKDPRDQDPRDQDPKDQDSKNQDTNNKKNKDLPTVTLLITAYNEQEIIAEKLQNSLALDYPRERLQIWVAADGSNDGTVEIVRSFANQGVEYSYSPPRRGKTAAINRAMPLVRGEIVVFSDGNNFYRPDTLLKLVEGFSSPQVGAVSGAKTIASGDGNLGEAEGLYWKYESAIKKSESRLGTCTGVAGEVMAIRRSLFEPIPDDIINDDFYIAMRLVKKGYRIAYSPEARSMERVSASASDEVVRRTRIVAGRYQAIARAPELLPWGNPVVVWQVISHKFLRPLVPLAMIGALAANLVAVLFPPQGSHSSFWRLGAPWNWIFLGLQGLFYLLAGAGTKAERSTRMGKLLYLPAFLVNSNLAALRGLSSFLRNQSTTNWQRVERREMSDIANDLDA